MKVKVKYQIYNGEVRFVLYLDYLYILQSVYYEFRLGNKRSKEKRVERYFLKCTDLNVISVVFPSTRFSKVGKEFIVKSKEIVKRLMKERNSELREKLLRGDRN